MSTHRAGARVARSRGLPVRTQLAAAAVVVAWLVVSASLGTSWQLDFLVIGAVGILVSSLDVYHRRALQAADRGRGAR